MNWKKFETKAFLGINSSNVLLKASTNHFFYFISSIFSCIIIEIMRTLLLFILKEVDITIHSVADGVFFYRLWSVIQTFWKFWSVKGLYFGDLVCIFKFLSWFFCFMFFFGNFQKYSKIHVILSISKGILKIFWRFAPLFIIYFINLAMNCLI